MLTHQRRTGEGRGRRISDFLTDRQFRALGLYRDFYRPACVDYQLAMTVPDGAGGLVGVALNRSGRDFSDTEVETLNLLRPHIHQAHTLHALLAATPPPTPDAPAGPPLTARQRQIMCLVADGHTDHTIGRLLGISTRTVQAHLQHAYRALHAASRTEALARLRG